MHPVDIQAGIALGKYPRPTRPATRAVVTFQRTARQRAADRAVALVMARTYDAALAPAVRAYIGAGPAFRSAMLGPARSAWVETQLAKRATFLRGIAVDVLGIAPDVAARMDPSEIMQLLAA